MAGADDVFFDVAAILLISAVAGAVASWLRQPLVVAFVLVGVVVGPSVAGLVQPGNELELLAEVGIAVLLFAVGLKLDLHVVRTTGPVAAITAVVQMALTIAIGFALAIALGLDTVDAVYVAVALAFSSTILVVKLLSDRQELDDLHGRIAVGILIVQDLAVVVALIAATASGEADRSVARALVLVTINGVALLAVLGVLIRWVLTPLLHRLAHSPDLLLLFAIAWAVALGAAGELLQLGTEVGAFLGGVSLASTPYREAIASRLTTIRDFLLLFFFIDLGSRLDVGSTVEALPPALALAAFVLVAKPLLVIGTLGALRYRRRVSLETGLALAQISEFSLILAAVGLGVDHIAEDTATLLVEVALITFTVSAYLILNTNSIYERLGPKLGVFERASARPEDEPPDEPPDVVVLGLGRYGSGIVERLLDADKRVLGVDFDPNALSAWEERGVDVVYGDVEDPDLPRAIPLPREGWVVSTIRRTDANLALLHALAHFDYRGQTAVAAHRQDEAERLRDAGADYVLLPYESAAAEVTAVVTG